MVIGKIAFFEKEIKVIKTNDNDINLNNNNLIELAEMHLINSPCCRLYNKDILKKNNILFKKDLSLGEDLLFNLEYLKYVNNVYIVNKDLYYYRRLNDVSLSCKYNNQMGKIQMLASLSENLNNKICLITYNQIQHFLQDKIWKK